MAALVAGPASGQGKTTVTAALALAWRQQGQRVRVFKCGPDFLDPMILARASGAPVYNLDLFMGGAAHAQQLLADAARDADVVLVEGVMGLFDGEPSAADLARLLGLPVLLVIDGSAMAQTFGAIAHGLATYQPGLQVCGVMANRVGSDSHAEMLRESLPTSLPWCGALRRDSAIELPERHLGLHQPDAVADLDVRLARAAEAVQAMGLPHWPEVDLAWSTEGGDEPAERLDGVTVAVAFDEALSFVYPANIDVLKALGARLVFFSPLRDQRLPACDALWLPGGYPELHLPTLASRQALWEDIRAHHNAGRPLWAECGGLLCLLESLTDVDGHTAPLAGLLLGHGRMQRRLAGLGMHEADLPEGVLRGHAFHYSTVDTPLAPLLHTQAQRAGRHGEPVWRVERLTASYFHAYFASNPAAVAALLRP